MKLNKTWLTFLALALASSAASGQTPTTRGAGGNGGNVVASESEFDTDFPPRKFDPRRYDAIFRKNPFMQEVVPAAKEAPNDPWADGLQLRAVSRIGGKFVVHVENTKLTKDEDREKRKMAYHRLVEGDEGEALRIQTVRPHRDPSQVEVVVATGTGTNVKTATIKYSEKQLAAKAPQVQPPKPGQPRTTRRTVTPRPTTPTTKRPTTTPGKRRVILPPGLPGSTQR